MVDVVTKWKSEDRDETITEGVEEDNEEEADEAQEVKDQDAEEDAKWAENANKGDADSTSTTGSSRNMDSSSDSSDKTKDDPHTVTPAKGDGDVSDDNYYDSQTEESPEKNTTIDGNVHHEEEYASPQACQYPQSPTVGELIPKSLAWRT
jgi:hypothetical protein